MADASLRHAAFVIEPRVRRTTPASNGPHRNQSIHEAGDFAVVQPLKVVYVQIGPRLRAAQLRRPNGIWDAFGNNGQSMSRSSSLPPYSLTADTQWCICWPHLARWCVTDLVFFCLLAPSVALVWLFITHSLDMPQPSQPTFLDWQF